MHTQLALYAASVLGAVALVLIMPKARWNARLLGALLGAATLGGLWWWVAPAVLEGISWGAFVYYYIFSAIAIAAAVRVITHTRPVYSALWFVMVVLATAGLFLVAEAPFMALAMVIIYAGAILVTYVFVIMLAAQSQTADSSSETSPRYDRLAREPLAATAAGFLLLAVLLSVAFEPMQPQEAARTPAQVTAILDRSTARLPEEAYQAQIQAQEGQTAEEAAQPAPLSNVEQVGLDLFRSHPLALELAGVILMASLIGAVVIARTHVPEEDRVATLADETGATAHPRYEPGPHSPETRGQVGGRMGV